MDHWKYIWFPFWNIFINFIWTFSSQDIAILPRCPVYGWILEEVGILTWRDHIYQNIANIRLNFGNSVNMDFIFDLWTFHLLSLLQSRDIVNLPKLINFSILGFFQLMVKLGFDFPRFSPNQKYRPRSLNFNFDEERNPMSSSLKNSSSVKSPNFLQQKLKMPEIKFYFDRMMRPSMET